MLQQHAPDVFQANDRHAPGLQPFLPRCRVGTIRTEILYLRVIVQAQGFVPGCDAVGNAHAGLDQPAQDTLRLLCSDRSRAPGRLDDFRRSSMAVHQRQDGLNHGAGILAAQRIDTTPMFEIDLRRLMLRHHDVDIPEQGSPPRR